MVGNSDLVGFWPVWGCGHLEKFRARAENRKTQFLGARGTFGKNPSAPKVYVLRFGRPDSHGRGNRKIHFRPKSNKTSYFGQKLVQPKSTKTSFLVKNQFFRPKLTKSSFSGQNRPEPVFSVQTQFLQSKSTKTLFFGQNRPKQVFPTKIDQTQIVRQKSTKT